MRLSLSRKRGFKETDMRRIGAAAAVILAAALPARADERHFTYSYEAQTHPKGALEYEQWATLRTRKEAGRFDVWQFRHELEYGVTDTLTTSLYLNWEFEALRGVPGVENEHEAKFETVSNEWKYKLTDPSIDPVGTLLYAEWAVGDDEMELELKGVCSKHLGDFTFAYNLIVELEREKAKDASTGEEEWERESVLSHTFGASYRANPNFAVGFEGVTRQIFE